MVKILSKLEAAAAGPVATPETPEAALARAAAEHVDAVRECEALIVRRAELLSTAGSDAEIEAVDLAIARVNRTIERRQMALPILRVQAEAARRAQTETQFIADYGEFRRAQNDFLLSYRAAGGADRRRRRQIPRPLFRLCRLSAARISDARTNGACRLRSGRRARPRS